MFLAAAANLLIIEVAENPLLRFSVLKRAGISNFTRNTTKMLLTIIKHHIEPQKAHSEGELLSSSLPFLSPR